MSTRPSTADERRVDETGVLAPGRWADVTVLSLDPLNVGTNMPSRLLGGSAVLTVVADEVVHQE